MSNSPTPSARRSAADVESDTSELERQLEQAGRLKIALARGECAGAKKRARQLLEGNALLRDLLPVRWWREDHTSSEEIAAALEAARARIGALSPDVIARFKARCADHARELTRLIERQENKTRVKAAALDQLQLTSGAAAKIVADSQSAAKLRKELAEQLRTAPLKSKELVEALQKALPHDAGAQRHIDAITGLPSGGGRGKASVKQAARDYLDTQVVFHLAEAARQESVASEHLASKNRYREVVGAVREKAGRRDHAPWEAIHATLTRQLAVASDPSTSRAIRDRLLEIEELTRVLAGKTALKAAVNRLFTEDFPRADFPTSMGDARWLRPGHAPAKNLLEAVNAAVGALSTVDTPEKRAALQKELERFAFLVRERKEIQKRIEDHERNAEAMYAALSREATKVREQLIGVRDQWRGLSAALRAERAKISESPRGLLATALVEANARLDAALTDRARCLAELEALQERFKLGEDDSLEVQITTSEASYDSADALCRRLDEAKTRAVEQVDAVKETIARLEVQIRQIVQVVEHYQRQSDALGGAMVRVQAAFERYKKVGALVCYFGLNDDILEKLLALGRFVKGGRTDIDAMGKIQLALAFDAGVRVGLELGILDLSAKVQLTLVIEGTLEVSDSREVVFSHRIAIYAIASVQATADSGKVGEALHLPVTVPSKMIGASAKAKCKLYDHQECHVYDDEAHWARRWAHEVARRLAFLRTYNAIDPSHEREGDDWVGAALAGLLAREPSAPADPRAGDAPDDVRAMLASALDEARGLRNRPPRVVAFEKKGALSASATVSVDGTTVAAVGSSVGGERFDVSLPGSATVLGELHEDSALSSYEADEVQHTIFHTLENGGKLRRYLEISDRRSSKLASGSFGFESAGDPEPPHGTSAERLTLARALHAAAAPPSLRRTVRLPPAAMTRGLTTDDPEALAKLLRARLDLLSSKRGLSKLEKLITELQKAPDQAAHASSTLATVSAQAAAVPARLSSAPAALADPVKPTVTTLADQIASLAGRASPELASAAETLDFLKAVPFTLVASSSAYMRFTNQPRFTHGPNGFTWTDTWVPQVYRGTNVKCFSLRVQQGVAVAPMVTVFFGVSVSFQREHAVYEVLGLDTLSYLKTLHASFRSDPRRWDDYWAMHGDELTEICRRVADTSAGAFDEVVYDAVEYPHAKAAALAFGEACWQVFRPTEESPFAALKLRAAISRVIAESKSVAIAAAIARRTPETLAARLRELRVDATPDVEVQRWRERTARAQKIGRDFEARRPRAPRLPLADREKQETTLQKAVTERRDQIKRWATLVPAGIDPAEKRTTERIKGAGELATAAARNAALYASEAAGLCECLALKPAPFTATTLAEISARPEPMAALAALVLPALVTRLGEAGDPPVPDASQWDARSSEEIGFFTGARWNKSAETQTLERAVTAHAQTTAPRLASHGKLAARVRTFADEVKRPAASRDPAAYARAVGEVRPLLVDIRAEIAARADALDALLSAVNAWVNASNVATSSRMPSVCLYLERPALLVRAKLDLLERFVSVLGHWGTALEARAELSRMAETPSADRLATNARGLVAMRRALTAYLEQTYGQFANHALMHGVKKVALPSEAIEAEKLKEEKPRAPGGVLPATATPARGARSAAQVRNALRGAPKAP